MPELSSLPGIDFRGSQEHIYKKFPDWYMKDPAQNPVLYSGAMVPIYRSCYTGYHRNEYANQFVSYVMKNYAVDGIWHNAPGVGGICYCPRCKDSYRKLSGKDIPIMENASQGELDEYMIWKAMVADEYMDRIKKTTKSFGEDKVAQRANTSEYGECSDNIAFLEIGHTISTN